MMTLADAIKDELGFQLFRLGTNLSNAEEFIRWIDSIILRFDTCPTEFYDACVLKDPVRIAQCLMPLTRYGQFHTTGKPLAALPSYHLKRILLEVAWRIRHDQLDPYHAANILNPQCMRIAYEIDAFSDIPFSRRRKLLDKAQTYLFEVDVHLDGNLNTRVSGPQLTVVEAFIKSSTLELCDLAGELTP